MTVDEQMALAKKAREAYLVKVRRILETAPAIEQEYWDAVESKDERRIQDALAADNAMHSEIGSAKWHFFQEIKPLKPPE